MTAIAFFAAKRLFVSTLHVVVATALYVVIGQTCITTLQSIVLADSVTPRLSLLIAAGIVWLSYLVFSSRSTV